MESPSSLHEARRFRVFPYNSRNCPIRLTGNTQGLSAFPLQRLERLAHRRLRADVLITPEFARALTEASLEIQRQVGVLLDRRGDIKEILVGDARAIILPDLSRYRTGRDRLCGLRLVHTHLHHDPLSEDDLTDLALLRLDLVAAIDVREDGLPGAVHVAHLLPDNAEGAPWEVLPPANVHELPNDFLDMIRALEDEFARTRKPHAAHDTRERAVLIHAGETPASIAEDSLEELQELARGAGIEVAHTFIQRRKLDPRYVIGRGKLQEVIIKAMQLGAETLVFDLNLAPSQIQALAIYTDLKILDRTQVILDIFAQHAETRDGQIQVELAQLRYLLPRLGAKQSASAFSRLTGGIGGRGPGETKLEIDRRRAQDRIAQLEREVRKLGERRKLRRGLRTRKQVPIASIVGYTNAGKSTLLNQLTQSDVIAQDALFATLNPVSRRLRFPREREVVITDTVGFIRELPKELLAAFRATLEELEHADLLLHVLDASRRDVDSLYETVQHLLGGLHLADKPTVVVLNKIDQCAPEVLEGLIRRYQAIPICALDRATFPELLAVMERLLWPGESDIMPAMEVEP